MAVPFRQLQRRRFASSQRRHARHHGQGGPARPPGGAPALLPYDGTASPTVGPNGDVFFGVLENVQQQQGAAPALLRGPDADAITSPGTRGVQLGRYRIDRQRSGSCRRITARRLSAHDQVQQLRRPRR